MKKNEYKSLAMRAQRSVTSMVNAINRAHKSNDNDELHELALAIGELQPGRLTVKGLDCTWDARYIYDETRGVHGAASQYRVAPNGRLAFRYPASYAGLVSMICDRHADRRASIEAARKKAAKEARKAAKEAARLAAEVEAAKALLTRTGYTVRQTV